MKKGGIVDSFVVIEQIPFHSLDMLEIIWGDFTEIIVGFIGGIWINENFSCVENKHFSIKMKCTAL